jgi:hypothetical protein
VLGGSGDPYVSKPLRMPAITSAAESTQRDKRGYADLRSVLGYVQEHPGQVESVLALALAAVRDRLSRVRIVYPVPNRCSLAQVLRCIDGFVAGKTGGLRLQVVAVALFRAIGPSFSLFSSVTSRHINSSDSRSGSVADLECFDSSGRLLMAIEVKDRHLTLRDAQDRLPGARERGIRELLYLVRGGVRSEDRQELVALAEHEFAAGQNVYVCEFAGFLESTLVLLQEQGRRTMLVHVGKELDEHGRLADRECWRELLQAL